MLSRFTFAIAYALTAFLALTGIASAADDKVEVAVGTGIAVLAVATLTTLIYGIKWWLGATEPPALPPEGLPYHSLPAGGHDGHDDHGRDAAAAAHH
jgi:hypothetical protein